MHKIPENNGRKYSTSSTIFEYRDYEYGHSYTRLSILMRLQLNFKKNQ
jgi:hypothetical protein